MTAPSRQIPWVGIDGLRAYQAGDLALVNQVPASGASGGGKDGPIVFGLMCTVAGRAVDNTTIDVWVKKSAASSFEQAIDDGVFQGGWTGTVLGTTPAGDRIVTIVPYFTFDSEAVVSVRVVADVDGGGGFAIDETYSYTVEDHLAPQLASATGWEPKKVRFTFNETGMGASALVAANYSIAPYQPGRRAAVTPTVQSVEALAVGFELTTDWELTPGAQYTLTAGAAVADAAGNPIDSSADSVEFTAYDYREPRRLFDGWKIYQQLAAYDRRRDMSGDLEKFSEVRQNALDLALKYVDDLKDLTDPDFCSAEYLDHLLYDNGNPLTFVTDEQLKRRIAWRCKELNKKRGTVPGIVLAVEIVTGLVAVHVADRSRRWKLGFREDDVEATVNELYLKYEAHRVLTTGGVHGAADTTNVISPSLYPADGEAETVALLNAILTAYEAHRVLTAGGVHGAADSTNVVYRAAATDWRTAANLSGEVRRKFNTHIVLTAGPVHGAADTINEADQRPGDALNFDTRLGGGASMPWDFWLQFDVALTAAQRVLVEQTADAMRAGNSHYLGTIEP